jgi:hypothetical protein
MWLAEDQVFAGLIMNSRLCSMHVVVEQACANSWSGFFQGKNDKAGVLIEIYAV